MDIKKKVFSYLFFCFSLLTIIYFVSADYSVTTSSGANNFTFNEDTYNYYNFSINNNYTELDNNITQVNISFTANFSIFINYNGTNSTADFSNNSNVLSWNNSLGVIPYNSTKSFWINSSVSNPGNYNITVILTNSTNSYYQNISVRILDTTPTITNNINHSITPYSSIIIWANSEPSNYTLYYNVSSAAGNHTLNNATLALSNSVTLNGLLSSTQYYYNLNICDEDNCSLSQRYNFTTSSLISNNSLFNYNATQNKNYSMTINNSDANSNITQINITLPLNFTFVSNTNTDDFEAYFNQSGRTLSWTNESGMILNQTINRISFNATTINNLNGTFNLTVVITNTYGISYSNMSVNIRDVTPPSFSSGPSDDATDTEVTITWTPNEGCNYSVNFGDSVALGDDSDTSNTRNTNQRTVSFDGLTAEDTYYYNVTICDQNSLCTTEAESFTTDAADSDGGSGGGADTTGFWTSTDSYSDKELSVRGSVNTTLAKGERARIKIDDERYYVGVIKLTSSSVTINVSELDDIWLSDKFSSGDSKKYEVTGDNYYDLEITLRSIKNSEANISIKYLHELKSNTLNRPSFNNTDPDSNITQNGSSLNGILGGSGLTTQPTKIVLFIIIAIVVLLVIGIIINAIGKIKRKGFATEEESLISKVKKEIKTKTSKRTKVNVKSP